MKRQPLALMIALVLLQTACSQQTPPQQSQVQAPSTIQPKPVAEVAKTPAEITPPPVPPMPQPMPLPKAEKPMMNTVEMKPAYNTKPVMAKAAAEKVLAKDIGKALGGLPNFAANNAPVAGVTASNGRIASHSTMAGVVASSGSIAGGRMMGRGVMGGSAGGVASGMVVTAKSPAMPAYRADSQMLSRESRDKFEHFKDNNIKQVATDPVSTFSLDVDTGSYALVRQALQQGNLPPSDAVRTEELINYFHYDAPKAVGEHPFAITTELSTAPWQPEHYLLRIGVQAQDHQVADMPPANLVFLVDVSGSMDESNKLPLVIKSLQMLTQQLRPQDKVSLVVYAGRTDVVLEPTSGANKAKILAALEQLQAGGSTNGDSALTLAYQMARQGYIAHGINRILLATDGDFNVGVTDTEQLKDKVKRERESGITLSTLGFGQGNFNDAMMEQIADVGNGNYSYIDSLTEARKVLVEELSSTFNTVAKDVKIQMEFNPDQISEYRLIGYENRQLNREDFNNDKVDAGDVGAGKSVTAIYELTPKGGKPSVDPLRYGKPVANILPIAANELAFLKLRYKKPTGDTSILLSQPVTLPNKVTSFAQSSQNQRFATAVAAFGQLLRHSDQMGSWSYAQVLTTAQQAKGDDATGTRTEFVQLVKNAQSLSQGASVDTSNNERTAANMRQTFE